MPQSENREQKRKADEARKKEEEKKKFANERELYGSVGGKLAFDMLDPQEKEKRRARLLTGKSPRSEKKQGGR